MANNEGQSTTVGYQCQKRVGDAEGVKGNRIEVRDLFAIPQICTEFKINCILMRSTQIIYCILFELLSKSSAIFHSIHSLKQRSNKSTKTPFHPTKPEGSTRLGQVIHSHSTILVNCLQTETEIFTR